jgi:integrase
VSALGFLFVKTLRRHFLAEYIPFPKIRKRLPTVLSPEEVAQLIDSARNLYHRTLLMTLYSTAMRRAELCRLKVRDIDSQRMMIRINQGKGGRDRDVPLSPKRLQTLRVYWRWMQPKTFLFPGTVKGFTRRRAHHPQCGVVGLSAGGPIGCHPQASFSPYPASQLCFASSGSGRRPACHAETDPLYQ